MRLALVALFSFAGCGTSNHGSDGAVPDLTASAPGDSAAAVDQSAPVDQAGLADLASAPDDLTALPDLTVGGACTHTLPGTCGQLASWTSEWLACNKSCSADMDCVKLYVHTNTFCKNACPVNGGKSADGAYLQSLTAAFNNMGCGNAGCACLQVPPPTCKQGVCM